MKPIKQIIAMYPSQNKCAAELGIHPSQLTRWVKAGAQVDADGNVWIKTTKTALRIWPDSSERVDIIPMMETIAITEYNCSGYTDETAQYKLLTRGAVTLEQAVEQFREYCGADFELLVCCNFECIEV